MNKQDYLLITLNEEATEVAHSIAKVLRFTPEHEAYRGGPTNHQELVKEFNEMIAVAELLKEKGFDIPRDEHVIARKKERVLAFMDYSRTLGVVE